MVTQPDALSVFKALEDEDVRLSSELERDPEYQRTMAALYQIPTYRRRMAVRDSIHSLRIAYGHQDITTGNIISSEGITRSTAVFSRKGSRENSITNRVSTAMEKQFRETGKRVGSAAVLSHVTELGIKISNKKPQNQVASILSHDPRFDNKSDDRGVGYGLVEWSTTDPGQEISDPTEVQTLLFGEISGTAE